MGITASNRSFRYQSRHLPRLWHCRLHWSQLYGSLRQTENAHIMLSRSYRYGAGMLTCTGTFYKDGNVSAARAPVTIVFLIGISFSFAYTPLEQLYPVECLKFEQRAKGVEFATMATNAALVNLFANVPPCVAENSPWRKIRGVL